jgi:tryptophanyl-tRNA synthetase
MQNLLIWVVQRSASLRPFGTGAFLCLKRGGSEMKRILTGDRTTGKLHLGHYVGSLQNRVKLQETYDTFIILADIQALTTHFESPEKVRQGIYDVAIDNLAAGLDPEKATLFQQSRVGAIAELTIFYSMLVTVNVLRHNPTIKTEAKQYGYDDLTYGFLGYPVSQTADITFCGADLVPVGEDQLPHIELTRKIVRRFNQLYGEQAGLVEPSPLLSETSRLVGLDGNSKMGKSLGNAIYLSDAADEVKAKVRAAVTDPARIMLKDIGHPEICTVARYHEVFNKGESEDIASRCRKAEIGCAACKNRLAEVLNQVLEPIRDRRAFYEARPEHVSFLYNLNRSSN